MLRKFSQSKRSLAVTAGTIAATGFAIAAIYCHNKRLEELERRTDLLISGGTVTAEAATYLMQKARQDNQQKTEVSS